MKTEIFEIFEILIFFEILNFNFFLLLYKYRSNTVISELNQNDNFSSEITIFISLSLYFAPFRCRRHMKTEK
jgi:hypothetical protein